MMATLCAHVRANGAASWRPQTRLGQEVATAREHARGTRSARLCGSTATRGLLRGALPNARTVLVQQALLVAINKATKA